MQNERANGGAYRDFEREHPRTSMVRHGFQPLLFAPRQRPSEPRPRASDPALARENDAPRRASESHVRLRVAPPAAWAPGETTRSKLVGNIEWLEAQDLLDEIGEDHLALSMKLACLERAIADRPRDPATLAALRTLDARLADLGRVRDVLGVLQLAAAPRAVQRAFLPDAPLAEYLRGLYAWSFAAVRALEQLVSGLRVMQPDWATYRWRIEEAKNFHFDELEDAIIEDLAKLFAQSSDPEAVTELTASFEVLLACARQLEERLDERFG